MCILHNNIFPTQVKSSFIEVDNRIIKDVLNASNHLKESIETFLQRVSFPDIGGIHNLLVFNICQTMEDTMHTLIAHLQTKACAIESLYGNRPSLLAFDHCKYPFCGPEMLDCGPSISQVYFPVAFFNFWSLHFLTIYPSILPSDQKHSKRPFILWPLV